MSKVFLQSALASRILELTSKNCTDIDKIINEEINSILSLEGTLPSNDNPTIITLIQSIDDIILIIKSVNESDDKRLNICVASLYDIKKILIKRIEEL